MREDHIFYLIPELLKNIANMDKNERKAFLEKMVIVDSIHGRWICQICSNSYTRKFTVIDHIEEKHLELASYQCDFCESLFTSSNLKRKHVREMHRQPNQFANYLVDSRDQGSLIHPVDTRDQGSLIHPVDTRDQGSLIHSVETVE